jgi:hypothetical protein
MPNDLQFATVKRMLIAPETGGPGVGVSALDNGASMIPTHAKFDFWKNGQILLEHDIMTGDNSPSDMVVGAQVPTIGFTMAWKGVETAAGDAVNMSAVTQTFAALRYMLENFIAPRLTTQGRTVTAGSAVGNLFTTSDVYNERDLIFVYQNGLYTPNRGEWTRCAHGNGAGGTPYVVSPNWTSAPNNTAIAYGSEQYIKPTTAAGLGFTHEVLIEIGGKQFLFNMGRIISAKISMSARQIVTLTAEYKFGSMQRLSVNRNALPIHRRESHPELQGRLCSMKFGDTAYEIESGEVDFGLTHVEVLSGNHEHGISNIAISGWNPTAAFVMHSDDNWEDRLAVGTKDTTLLQWGAGVLASARVNTGCIFFERGQVTSHDHVNADGIWRNQVTIAAKDPKYPDDLVSVPPNITIRGDLFRVGRA